MEKLSIISVQDPKGGYTGYLKDKPGVVAEGNNHVELVQNLMSALKVYSEVEKDLKK